ncbi:hypothetical protein NP233_g6125 [Leucocoprinus birnbaumii]|uniref:Uncharacterized protein n=1 Tax=Leucocoprinus birnbaumii TaxID=56174 RepID=A0AAD5VV38_9AGAR|nr:hypothetical protein NP233_g6125 [Leucocoprinus birnbaumii]
MVASFMQPFPTIPDDVLIELFLILKSQPKPQFSDPKIEFIREHRASTHLRLVSRRWNVLIQGIQSFWTTMYIILPLSVAPLPLFDEWKLTRTVTLKNQDGEVIAAAPLHFTLVDDLTEQYKYPSRLLGELRNIFAFLKSDINRFDITEFTRQKIKRIPFSCAVNLQSLTLTMPSSMSCYPNKDRIAKILTPVATIPDSLLKSLTIFIDTYYPMRKLLLRVADFSNDRNDLKHLKLALRGKYSSLQALSERPYILQAMANAVGRIKLPKITQSIVSEPIIFPEINFLEIDDLFGKVCYATFLRTRFPKLRFLCITGVTLLVKVTQGSNNVPFANRYKYACQTQALGKRALFKYVQTYRLRLSSGLKVVYARSMATQQSHARKIPDDRSSPPEEGRARAVK